VAVESLSQASPKPRTAGRPRQSGLDEQIVAAVVRLLAHKSYSDISMELIAQEAGVGKATVYRRWPHKAALIVDVLLEAALAMQIPFPDNVSYRDHLAAGMRGLRDMLSSHFSKAIIAIISETQHNDALRQRFYEGFVSRMQAIGEADLEVAIARGEVRADVDKELVFDQVFGLFYYRLLMVQKPLDDKTIEHIVDIVMKQLS
jgi:AcrR family transcriptional regulator